MPGPQRLAAVTSRRPGRCAEQPKGSCHAPPQPHSTFTRRMWGLALCDRNGTCGSVRGAPGSEQEGRALGCLVLSCRPQCGQQPLCCLLPQFGVDTALGGCQGWVSGCRGGGSIFSREKKQEFFPKGSPVILLTVHRARSCAWAPPAPAGSPERETSKQKNHFIPETLISNRTAAPN